MEMIGRYKLITKFNNKNAGTCQWCYAVCNGQEYFIKRFPEPKYPNETSEASAKTKARKLTECAVFEKEKTRLYRAVNNSSDGNAVRITDFFRVDTFYYMAMPRVKTTDMSVEAISKLPENIKRRICMVLAHSLAQLHAVHFVHSDIKASNVLFTYSKTRKLTAKLIDYDAGFFEDSPPCAEEVCGDQNYYSPEALVVMCGGEAKLTCKLDVFALGILFHQYYTGEYPSFDREKHFCAGDAVAAGSTVEVSRDMPMDIHRLIRRMLATYPDERPSAQEVFNYLTNPNDMFYKVSHEVEGKTRDILTYKQHPGNYDDNKVTIRAESLMPRVYEGYKYDKTEPWVVEGETVTGGTVITIKYIKDTTKQKVVSYTVQHKVDGQIIEQSLYTKRVWINAPDELPIETGSITPRIYAGCSFETINTDKKDGEPVPCGAIIVLSYSTNVSGNLKLGRPGFWDMGDL